MAIKDNGALGATLIVTRGMQVVSLIAIIGMTANFISEMVSANTAPPDVLIGTLTVTCMAVLYCVVTLILYYDNILPLHITAGLDALVLIAVIVVAVIVGKPLSYLNCTILPRDGGNTAVFMESVGANLRNLDYFIWAGASSTTCFEMKAIWGLSIALCILFSFSSICMGCLWKMQRDTKAAEVPKDFEG